MNLRWYRTALTMVSLLAGATASSQAPWLIDVPEDVRTLDLPAVTGSLRTGRIDLVRDLSINDRSGDPDYILYQPTSVAVDQRGRIFVLDAGMHHIQVYDDAGEHVTTIGSEGAGPGEFSGPSRMTIAGDRLIVTDARQARVSIWSTDGEHVQDHLVDRTVGLGSYFGLGDGRLIGTVSYRDQSDRPAELLFASQDTVGVFDELGTRVRELATMPLVVPVALRRVGDGQMSYVRADVPQPSSEFVAAEDGRAFAANTAEYQVFAFQHDRGMVWALNVAWDREALSDEATDAALKKMRERVEDVRRSEVEFPDLKPALSRLSIDARGFLYVFPYVEVERGADRPVDVYSPAGERVFAGWIPEVRWTAVHDDHVYAIEPDRETQEQELVRYRLQRPW